MASPEKKKVAFFMPESYPSYSGAGRNALQFAGQLSGRGLDVTICVLNYNRRLKAEEDIRGVKIKRLPYYNRNLFTKMGSLPILLFRYRRCIRNNDAVFIWSAYLIGFQYIILFASRAGRKVIFRSSLLGGDDALSLLGNRGWLSGLNAFCLKKISLYFSINDAFTKSWFACFADRVKVFQSFQGVDTHRFQPVSSAEKRAIRERLGMTSGEFVIISVGSLLNKKGYNELFAALEHLDINFRYYIIGYYQSDIYHHFSSKEVKEMSTLRESGRSRLGNRMVLTGVKENVEAYYQAADIFLHGANAEGTPNSLLEAMACGLPCIVKRLEGISGFLLNAENSMEFEHFSEVQEKISLLYGEREQAAALGEAARETILAKADMKTIADRFSKLL